MVKVVVIKFKNGGKLYYFSPKNGDVYERNMPVIVYMIATTIIYHNRL